MGKSHRDRPIASRIVDSPRFRSGQRLARAVVLVGMLLGGRPAPAEEPKSGSGLAFSGRVVELEAGSAVQGATVIVERSIRGVDPQALPPWAGEVTMRTDADGRFGLSFPREQVAEPRLTIMVRVKHPGFIAKIAESPPRRDHPRTGQGRRTVLLDHSARERRRVHGPGGDTRGQAGGGDTLSVRELGVEEQSVRSLHQRSRRGDR